MRVGIDGRSLVQPSRRGVARYTHTLLSELARAFPQDDWLVLVPAGGQTPGIPGVEFVRSPLPGRILYGAAAIAGTPRLDRLLGGVDVFWAPAPAPLALGEGTPLVLTVHDLAWEARPQDFTAYERLWHRIARPRALGERAARIVAVSEATRAELLSRWGVDADRVVTVLEAIPPAPPVPHTRARSQPYFLSVGALEPRKAPDVLLSAYGKARNQGITAELLIAGEGRLGRMAH